MITITITLTAGRERRTPFPPENSFASSATASPPLSSETTAATPSLTHQPSHFLPRSKLRKPSAFQGKYKKSHAIHNIASSTSREGTPPLRFNILVIRGRTEKGPRGFWCSLSRSHARRRIRPQRTGPTWCPTLRSSWLSVSFLPHPFLRTCQTDISLCFRFRVCFM